MNTQFIDQVSQRATSHLRHNALKLAVVTGVSLLMASPSMAAGVFSQSVQQLGDNNRSDNSRTVRQSGNEIYRYSSRNDRDDRGRDRGYNNRDSRRVMQPQNVHMYPNNRSYSSTSFSSFPSSNIRQSTVYIDNRSRYPSPPVVINRGYGNGNYGYYNNYGNYNNGFYPGQHYRVVGHMGRNEFNRAHVIGRYPDRGVVQVRTRANEVLYVLASTLEIIDILSR